MVPEGLREKMRKYDCLRELPLLFPHSYSQRGEGGCFQRRQDEGMWKTFLLAKMNAILLFL